MLDLFLSECRRYRRATLIFAATHLLLQLLFSRLNNILTLDAQIVVLAAYALAGMGLALHQIGSYRQPSRWMWLMHRPLTRGAIFGALTLASAAIIVVAIGLPLWFTVLGTDWLSERTVDLRHYLAVGYVVMVTVIAWLGGAAVMLGASRFAALIMILPYLMLLHESTAASLLVATVPCAALMAVIVYASFKPNRATAPEGRVATTLSATPLVLGFYCLLLWGALGLGQTAAIALGVQPRSMAVPPAGGFEEARSVNSRALMLTGLANATDPRAAHWRRQVPLLELGWLRPEITRFAVPQQLSNKHTPQAKDPERSQQHNFNHNTMRFDVTDARTGALVSTMGLGGMGDSQAFPAVPRIMGQVLTPRQALHYNGQTQRLIPLVTLPADEQLASPLKRNGDFFYLLTNRRVIAYAGKDTQATAPYQQKYSIALPGPLSNLERIDVAQLLDGTLISFTEGRDMTMGAPHSAQTLFFVDTDGHAQLIAKRAIGHDYPLLFEHAEWWLSPVLHAVASLPELILPSGAVPDYQGGNALSLPRPASMWAAAALSSILAVAGAWLWRRRALHGQRIGAGWLLACAAFGLPCLAGLVVMYPQRAERKAPVAHLAATVAA